MADKPEPEDDRRYAAAINWIDPDYDPRIGEVLRPQEEADRTVSDHDPPETPTKAARVLIGWFAGALAFEAVHAYAEQGSVWAALGYGIAAVVVAFGDYKLNAILASTPSLTKTLNRATADARLWIAVAMLSLLVIAISPYIEQRRWPFAWQFTPSAPMGFTQQQVDQTIATKTAPLNAQIAALKSQLGVSQAQIAQLQAAQKNPANVAPPTPILGATAALSIIGHLQMDSSDSDGKQRYLVVSWPPDQENLGRLLLGLLNLGLAPKVRVLTAPDPTIIDAPKLAVPDTDGLVLHGSDRFNNILRTALYECFLMKSERAEIPDSLANYYSNKHPIMLWLAIGRNGSPFINQHICNK